MILLRATFLALALGAVSCQQPGTIIVQLRNTSACGAIPVTHVALVAAVGQSCPEMDSKGGCVDAEQICTGSCSTPCALEAGGPARCPANRLDGDLPLALPEVFAVPASLLVAFTLYSDDLLLGGGCQTITVDRSTADVEVPIDTVCCRGP